MNGDFDVFDGFGNLIGKATIAGSREGLLILLFSPCLCCFIAWQMPFVMLIGVAIVIESYVVIKLIKAKDKEFTFSPKELLFVVLGLGVFFYLPCTKSILSATNTKLLIHCVALSFLFLIRKQWGHM